MNKVFLSVLMFVLASCSNKNIQKEYIYVPIKDTKDSIQYVTTIVNLTHEKEILRSNNDSLSAANNVLNRKNDSIAEELFIAKYKLDRIKYYNSIAAKNNNIKYLRGWINRVLDE